MFVLGWGGGIKVGDIKSHTFTKLSVLPHLSVMICVLIQTQYIKHVKGKHDKYALNMLQAKRKSCIVYIAQQSGPCELNVNSLNSPHIPG